MHTYSHMHICSYRQIDREALVCIAFKHQSGQLCMRAVEPLKLDSWGNVEKEGKVALRLVP